jgi:AcrR family transcriptional regulator
MADPRRPRTRRALLDAGRRLIAQKGVATLRISHITEEANVALGSFYNHFATKEELVEAVLSETLASLAAEIVSDETTHDDIGVVAITALRRFVRLAYDDPQFSRVLVNMRHSEELFLDAITPYASGVLERATRERAFVVEDIDVACAAVLAGALAIMRKIIDGGLGPDADVALAQLVLRGFSVDPAEAARIIEKSRVAGTERRSPPAFATTATRPN